MACEAPLARRASSRALSPNGTNMSFKRPCWLALCATSGMMLLGYFGFLSTASYWADKQADGWWWVLIGIAVYLLVIVGALGVVVSLIWCLVKAIGGRGQSAANDQELFRKLLDEHRRGQG